MLQNTPQTAPPAHPQPVVDPDFARLVIAARDHHPLVTFLRQKLIVEILDTLNIHHREIFEAAARDCGVSPDMLAKGLCVKGSATLPISLRRANDLDFTIDIGTGYAPYQQRAVILKLFEHTCARMKKDDLKVQQADLSSPLFSDIVKKLEEDKVFSVLYMGRVFSLFEYPSVVKELKRLFDINPCDLPSPHFFIASPTGEILSHRLQQGKKLGQPYNPTFSEKMGFGVFVSVGIELASLDALNVFAPYAMGGSKGDFQHNFEDRNKPREASLSFANPFEETVGKVFTILTDRQRAQMDIRHARDLVDLYIRTGPEELSTHAWAPFRPRPPGSIIPCLQLAWPAHPAFFGEGGLYLKKIDPSVTPNVKQIRNGLLRCAENGSISSAVFGKPITEANAHELAERLLNHTWQLISQAFGVQRSGSNNDPQYELVPHINVRNVWGACRSIRVLARTELGEAAARQRADRSLTRLQRLMRKSCGEIFNQGTCSTFALNAFLNADRSRHWSGLNLDSLPQASQ